MKTLFNKLSCLFTVLVFITAAGGCKDKEDEVCDPGELQTCPCPGGAEGVQECRSDQRGWGACQGCNSAPTGTVKGECEYTGCTGDICENEEQCCEDAACNAWYFSPDSGYIENYCYPTCDLENPEALCKCDDVCLDDGQLALCVKTGFFYAEELSFPIGRNFNNRSGTAISNRDYEVDHGFDYVSFSQVEAYFEETDDGENTMVLRLVGLAGLGPADLTSFWLLNIEIYESTWSQGRGTFEMLNENGELNFLPELDFIYVDDDGNFTDKWRETLPDSESSQLTIHQACEPCAAFTDPADCDECVLSFDFPWFAVRAKVEVGNEVLWN